MYSYTKGIKEKIRKIMHEHTCWTESLFRAVVDCQIMINRNRVIHQCQVGWLVMVVIGASEGYRGQKVKTHNSVWSRVVNNLTLFGWF